MSQRVSPAGVVFGILLLGAVALLAASWIRGSRGSSGDPERRLASLENDAGGPSARKELADLADAVRSLEDQDRVLEAESRSGARAADGDSTDPGARRRDEIRAAREEGSRDPAPTDHPERGTPEWEAQMREYAEQTMRARVADVRTHLELDEEQTSKYREILEEEDRLLRDLWSQYQVTGSGRTTKPILKEAAKIRAARDDKLRALFGEEAFAKYKSRYPDPPPPSLK